MLDVGFMTEEAHYLNLPDLYVVRYLLILLLAFLLLPLVFTGFVGGSLVGHTPATKPVWALERWFSGDWQEQSGEYLREHFGFRNDFVRLNNLKNYKAFGEIAALTVVEGKEGYFYEDTYLKSVTGMDAEPPETFDKLGKEMTFVRDSLKAHGVELLVVMAPGKGSYFPEYRPEPYASLPLTYANEKSLLRTLRERQIPHLNFNQWFREMKDTTSYPLFPQKGIHWTLYGQLLGLDSIVNYVGATLGIDMPEVVIDSVEVSSEQRGMEADIFRGMNLPYEPTGFPIGYPSWSVKNPEKPQPKVLFIGDSFYWNLYLHHQANQKFFDDGDFYYYFSRLMRNGWDQGNMDDVFLPEDLFEYDMVVIIETESHYQRMGNGFLAETVAQFVQYREGEIPDKNIRATMEEIRGYPDWMADIEKKARDMDREVEEVLYSEAKFMLEQSRKEKAIQ